MFGPVQNVHTLETSLGLYNTDFTSGLADYNIKIAIMFSGPIIV